MPLPGRGRRQQQAAHTVQWLGYLAALRPCTPPRDIPNHRSWEPRHGAKMAAHARALCRCSPPVAPRALACAAAARPPRRTAAQADMLATGTIRQRPLLLCKCWRAESGVVQAGREGEAGAVDGAAEAMLSPRGARKIGAVRRAARSLHWHPMKRSRASQRAGATYGVSEGWNSTEARPCDTQRGCSLKKSRGSSKRQASVHVIWLNTMSVRDLTPLVR